MRLKPGSRVGPYEIGEVIGAGGMGEVYRARDTRLERTVAIKVLPAAVSDDAARPERFEHEARSIAADQLDLFRRPRASEASAGPPAASRLR